MGSAKISHRQRATDGWLSGASGRCAWLVLALLAGCASPPPTVPLAAADPAAACEWLDNEVDRMLAAVPAGDAAAARIPGFPGLRVNRLLASFNGEAAGPARLEAWARRLATLDAEARSHELAVLDSPALRQLARGWQAIAADYGLPEQVEPALDRCREERVESVLRDPAAAARLRQVAVVPDAYRDWQRAVGLYPLAVPLVRPRVVALQARLSVQFDAEPDAAADWRRYAPPASPDQPPGLRLDDLPRDALGFPLLDEATRAAQLAAHAPAWWVETAGAADFPGAVLLDAHDQPFVATWHPVVYQRLGYTRFGDDVLVQLSYTLWFSERPRAGAVDLYAGALDSVTWRVTLDGNGQVLAYDSVHGCGCYYLLLPGPGWRVAPVGRGEEPVFSPAPSPVLAAGERMELRLAAGTHYLVGVAGVPAALPARELFVLDEDELRALPRATDGRRSAYAPDGLIPVSRRPERFLLWPLGVPSAGAQRQPGTQAIAFIGRRHFDDARLLETLLEPAR